jgi:dTDP-4-dehydrorhamnose 3,5-epimerase-like enzyme
MVKIIELPKIIDRRGNLSFFENSNHIPFEIKRTYWIYDVPGGETRGGHAYKELQEIIIALSGSFDVHVECSNGVEVFSLNRSYNALYLPPGTWRSLQNFSTNAVCLVAASDLYNENDYIRDYQQFKSFIQHGK